MMATTRIDILGGKNVRCRDCDNQFGIHFAMNGGICISPLCFRCIMRYADEQNLVID